MLNTATTAIEEPEGMAFDPANGRIYTTSDTEQIIWVAVDGSGSGVLDTGKAPVENPEGIVLDPATQTVYWANGVSAGSIGYASANGGNGGALNTTGAAIQNPYRLALDTVNGRVYWVNTGNQVFYANLNGSGGGSLNLPEGERPKSWTGFSVDPGAGRLYILGVSPSGKEGVYWVNLSGVGGGVVDITGASFHDPYGLAFDPSTSRFYWGNFGNENVRTGALGTVTLTPGTGGGISIATAPLESPQDPLVLKSPTGTGAPQVTKNAAALSCSQGTWSPDYPGSFVYAAPVSYSYQWLLNGQAIAGATSSTYTATTGGSYACAVTGKNATGSATQTSPSVTVISASVAAASLTKKPHAKAGKPAVVQLRLTNSGEVPSAPGSVCAKLTKAAKKGLIAPKCAPLGAIAAGGTAKVTLRVKTKKSAKGSYKVSVAVTGSTAVPLPVTIKVTAAKKHKKHHKQTHPKKK
jgi:DNA-binding beta-propeller fold protein YncE